MIKKLIDSYSYHVYVIVFALSILLSYVAFYYNDYILTWDNQFGMSLAKLSFFIGFFGFVISAYGIIKSNRGEKVFNKDVLELIFIVYFICFLMTLGSALEYIGTI